MSRRTSVEVAESTIMMEEEMLVRKKSIARYRQDSNSDKSKDFDEEKK